MDRVKRILLTLQPIAGELSNTDGGVPILVIESYEEPRVLEMITRLAVKRTLPLYVWSCAEGLNGLGFGDDPSADTPVQEPENVLRAIKAATEPALYVLCDFHPSLSEPQTVRLLREVAMRHDRLPHTVVLLIHELNLPREVRRYSVSFEISMSTEAQLMTLVRKEAAVWSKQRKGAVVPSDAATFRKLVNNLKGGSLQDAKQLIRAPSTTAPSKTAVSLS